MLSDRVQEVHDFLGTENHRQPEGPLGHRNLFHAPAPFERYVVEETQRAGRNADTAWGKHAGLRQMDLVGTNRFRTEFLRRAVKVPCIGDDLLHIGRLGVLGEVADGHIFEHPLA